MNRLVAVLMVLCVAGPAFAIEEYKRVQFHSGSIADGDGSTVPVTQYGTLGVDVAITNTATVTFQGRSADGSFQDLRCLNVSSGAVGSTATSSGTFQCPVSGLAEVKMPISSCSSCTVSASGRVTTATIAGLADITASVSGADGAILDGVLNTIKATVKDYTNSNPLTTIIVDTNGDPASIGGGTQYNQGTASTTTDTMTMAGATRRDTAAVATGVIDGDRTGLSTDSAGRLRVTADDTTQPISGTVTVTDGAGALNVIVDSGTVTAVTSITNPVTVTDGAGALNVIVDSSALPTGAATAANQDGIIKDGTGDTTQANVSSGALHVAVQGTATVSGTVTVTDGAGALNVICDSGCSGGTQYAEDTVHSSGDQLTLAGVVRSDAAAALAADGDRTVLQVDANGYLKVVNINPNLAADNSTLSTAKVPVLPGTVSTSAPTWTSGNQSALSLQTDGSVRAAITNSVTVTDGAGALNVIVDSSALPTGAATAANQDGIIKDGTGDTTQANVSSGALHVAQQGTVTVTATNLDVQIGGSDTLVTNPGTAANWGIYVEDAAETAGANLAMAGSVRRDTAASSAGTAGDNATVNTDGLGRLWVREGSPCADHARITSASISESTAATNEIVALNASDLIYVCGYKWVTTAANSLSWKYGTGTDCATGTTSIEGAQPFAANGGVVENGGGYPIFIVPAGNALCLTSSAATAHGGRVTYVRTAAP